MGFNRAELKMAAKEQIRGKIWPIFAYTLLVIAIIALVAFIPILGAVALIILSPALDMGLIYLFMDVRNGEELKISTLFKAFSENFGKAWCLYFLMNLFISLWSLLFIIPGFVKAYSYSMAPYILAENPEISALEAINRSKEMTMGYKGDLFVLDLSFIGWTLLGSITFGLAYIYVLPYMSTTVVNAYYALKENR